MTTELDAAEQRLKTALADGRCVRYSQIGPLTRLTTIEDVRKLVTVLLGDGSIVRTGVRGGVRYSLPGSVNRERERLDALDHVERFIEVVCPLCAGYGGTCHVCRGSKSILFARLIEIPKAARTWPLVECDCETCERLWNDGVIRHGDDRTKRLTFREIRARRSA